LWSDDDPLSDIVTTEGLEVVEEAETYVLSEHDRQVADACLKNAEDLVSSADLSLERGSHHIAFHLAVLALEELGKRQIVMLNAMSQSHKGSAFVSPKKLDDHIGKLFWCFFSQYIFMESLDQSKIDEISGMATFLHERRLESLYVDTERSPFVSPKDTVPLEQVENVVLTARSQLEMEKCFTPQPLTSADRRQISWLLDASNNDQLRTFVFSRSSMEKFREIGRFPGWVDWLQTELAAEHEKVASMIQAERERGQAGMLEGRSRWQFEVRLAAISHKLKPSELNDWNSRIDCIKFRAGGKKPNQDLIITLLLPDRIRIDGLYLAGKALAEKVMLALNIVTLGFFWWDRPNLTARFTDAFKDIDSNTCIILNEVPVLALEWKAEYLTDEDLSHVGVAFAYLPSRFSGDVYAPFAWYVDGLGFMASVNVHRRHEAYAFRCFYESYWSALRTLGEADGSRSEQVFIESVNVELRDADTLSQLYKLGEELSGTSNGQIVATLEDVGKMKLLADIFFIEWIKRANSEAASNLSSSPEP
jgi:AbiV family abortive infection protein